MAIKSLASSGVVNFEKHKAFSAGYESNQFHHLETVRLSSTTSSVTFSNLEIYSDFQHLQLRMITRDTVASTDVEVVRIRLNGDSTSNYNYHQLQGNGSAVSSYGTATDHIRAGLDIRNSNTSGSFTATITDLLDPFETTKYTTARSLSGLTSGVNYIGMYSGLWRNTAAVTAIDLSPSSGSWLAGCRFSLYGFKARS